MVGMKRTLSGICFLGLMVVVTEADVTCSHPGLVPHAELQGNPGPFPVPVNTVLHFICEPCHHGDGTMTCLSNGQWSQRPECIRVGCHDPGPVANSNRQGNVPFHCNSVVTYTCQPGYNLYGSISLHCLDNGVWNMEPPVCISQGATGSCGDPGQIANAVQHGGTSGSSFPVPLGTRIRYACDSCYSGGGTVTCLGSGRWTTLPSCTDVSCHDPGFMDNGYRDGQSPFLCHSTVTYSCHPGLYLRGSPHLTCQGDGTWNVAKPTCEAGGPSGTEPSTGEEEGDDNSTTILLGVFLPLIFLVLIIILIVVLLRRECDPLDRIIAWWKRKTGSTDNGQTQQPNNPGNNTSGNQGNNTSSNQGRNASNSNASQNPLRRMIAWWEKKSPGGNDTRQPHELESNIPGNATSNVTASQNANAVSNKVYMTGGKEEFVNKVGVQGAEAPLTYSCPKEKEAGFSDPPPSYDMYYEEVNAQKGKLKT